MSNTTCPGCGRNANLWLLAASSLIFHLAGRKQAGNRCLVCGLPKK